jgi:hypothetical protein
MANSGATAVDRMRELLEAAAAELEARREDVLSSMLILPRNGLDHDECAAFLRAIDAELAILDAAGYVTVPDAGRFPLLSRSGMGVGVDVARIAQVGSLAAG